jgi:WD40 repeat protein
MRTLTLSTALLLSIVALCRAQDDNRMLGQVTLRDVKVAALAMHSESKHIVVGYTNGSMSIFEPKPKRVIKIESFPAHNRVTFAAIGADNKWVATGGADGTVKLWETYVIGKWQEDCENLKDGVPKPPNPSAKKMFTAHMGASVNGIAFSPDGKRLATCGSDGSLKFWNIETGTPRLVYSITAHKGAAHAVAISPDGELIATAGADKTAKLWKPVAGKPPVHTLSGHEGPVLAVAFSANGKQVASASGAPKKGGSVRVWDVETGKEDFNLGKLDDIVTTLSFHPKLPRLALGGADKKVRVWNTETKKQLYTEDHVSPIVRVQFTGDGVRLGTACPEEVKYWKASPKIGD